MADSKDHSMVHIAVAQMAARMVVKKVDPLVGKMEQQKLFDYCCCIGRHHARS